jgi:hypothetical protein
MLVQGEELGKLKLPPLTRWAIEKDPSKLDVSIFLPVCDLVSPCVKGVVALSASGGLIASLQSKGRL